MAVYTIDHASGELKADRTLPDGHTAERVVRCGDERAGRDARSWRLDGRDRASAAPGSRRRPRQSRRGGPGLPIGWALPDRRLVNTVRPAPPVAATSSPETAQTLSEARNTATNAISEASTMRQMALPRGKSGAKSCRSASSGDTPSWWRTDERRRDPVLSPVEDGDEPGCDRSHVR
jgi:hypothetical protein